MLAPQPAGVTGTPASLQRRTVPSPWLRRVLLVNLVLEVLIVVTGGAVRLTGSGLGCPTWPQCVPGSFRPVVNQAQGFHKYIEFGNRTLISVVGLAALAVIAAVWVWGRGRTRLRVLSFAPLLGVVAQALIGGVTVLTGLNPTTVAVHFLVSMAIVAASAVLLHRAGEGDGLPQPLVRGEIRLLGWAATAVGAAVLVLGTVVTGSGPHSGDATHPTRFGFDPRAAAWLHADVVMLFAGLVVAVLLAVRLTDAPHRVWRAWLAVALVTLAQGLVGYTQYFTGLPGILVGVHLLGASLLVVALTFGVLSLRTR